jgi:hypothetical protein
MCTTRIISMTMMDRSQNRTAIGTRMHLCGTAMHITLIYITAMGIAEKAEACGADIWATLKPLTQADIGKGAGEFGGDGSILFAALGDIARGVFRLHVAPALKRAAGDGFSQYDIPVKVNGAAQDAIVTARFFKAENTLATQDQALDYPVNAATFHVRLPFWPHAGDVDCRACGPAVALAVLPIGQVFDGYRADT